MSNKKIRKIRLFDYLSKMPYAHAVPVLYSPDNDVVELEARNYLSDKTHKMTVTAEKMSYYAFLKDDPYKKVDKQLYLVGTRPTRNFVLTFEGEEDFYRGLATMQKYSKLYGNKQLGGEGILIDKEIGKYIPRGRIESNMRSGEGFWTGTIYKTKSPSVYLQAPEFGLHNIRNLQIGFPGYSEGFVVGKKELVTGDFSWSPSHYEFYWKGHPVVHFEIENGEWIGESINWTYGMLPLVCIPNDMLADEDKILKNEPSQLYRP